MVHDWRVESIAQLLEDIHTRVETGCVDDQENYGKKQAWNYLFLYACLSSDKASSNI